MVFFKDVTFGVLYEEVKGKDLLQNMIDNTLYNKVASPLEKVVDTCKNLETSLELRELERTLNLQEENKLSTKLIQIHQSS